MNSITATDIHNLLKRYNVIRGRLVIINIRSNDRIGNNFDDITIITFDYNVLMIVKSSCDAGLDNLISPVNVKGTAIVMNGYYPEMWSLGLHKGKYEALVQTHPVAVIRDNNKDNVLDYPDVMFTKAMLRNIKKGVNHIDVDGTDYLIEYGYFGINLHRASQWRELSKVGLYSAGCCVIQNPNRYADIIHTIKDYSKDHNLNSVDAIYINNKLFNN